MALKFSQFTSSKVCSVIFNQSTYFGLTNVSRYGSCCLVRLKIDFANMFQGAEVAHASEAKDEDREDGHVLGSWSWIGVSHLSVLINQSRKETQILFRVHDLYSEQSFTFLQRIQQKQHLLCPAMPHQQGTEQALLLRFQFLMEPVGFSKLH